MIVRNHHPSQPRDGVERAARAERWSFIMPFLNEADHLPEVLKSLSGQSFDHAKLWLIAIDNDSTDGGAQIVADWLAGGDIGGEVVHAKLRSIPHALNCGVAAAAVDDYIIRLDAHSVYESDYVAHIARAFASATPNVWCVGGAPDPGPQQGLARGLVAALFTNPMGLGPAAFRSSSDVRPVSSVYLGAWRPGVLQRLGGYDERWKANEDSELAARARAAGGTILRIPVHSRLRISRGPWRTVQQWARYGFWRAQTLKAHRAELRLRHLAPPAALLGALVLALSPLRSALIPLSLAYFALILRGRRPGDSPLVTAASLLYFPLIHVAFAGGLLTGLVRRATKAGP